MNRLVIIGNGFDLAHGLKTRYSDFIDWYIFSALKTLRDTRFYESELLYLKTKDTYFNNAVLHGLSMENCRSRFNYVRKDSLFSSRIKCEIFNQCYEKIEQTYWVDIENEYFLELSKAIKNGVFDKNKAVLTNGRFAYLKAKLHEYLTTQELPLNIMPDGRILQIFQENFRGEDFANDSGMVTRPLNICLLDFNYTRTSLKYLEHASAEFREHMELNQIHGCLSTKDNPPVFGFGDEYDKVYAQFEDFNENEVYKHIKSFAYLKAVNYRRLLRFLSYDSYQVVILGHSCGLSDRTMLRKIMDSDRCRSVKIYYHQISDIQNDYTEKTYNLSRHFRDKEIMREKIVPEPYCSPMPQPIDLIGT